MPRVRTTSPGALLGSTPFLLNSAYISDENKKPRSYNPCYHWKYLGTYTGPWRSPVNNPSSIQYVSNWVYSTDGYPNAVVGYVENQIFSSVYLPLDFQRNNEFELLNFVGELDDFIAVFTRKFWQQISYGSANWGLLPLISDIRSLMSTIEDFRSQSFTDVAKYNNRPYRLTRSYSFSGTTTPGNPQILCNWFADFTVRMNGYTVCDMPNFSGALTALQILLDELGVHPDLKTVWDLIPLSFVIDYFLPIGSILESLHPRGWFDPVFTFRGASSIKGIITHDAPLSSGYNRLCSPLQVKVYKRLARTLSVRTRKPALVDWKAPTLRELFNAWYVGNSGKLGSLRF